MKTVRLDDIADAHEYATKEDHDNDDVAATDKNCDEDGVASELFMMMTTTVK